MKHAIRVAFVVLLLASTGIPASAARLESDAVVGLWKAKNGDSILEVKERAGSYSTTIVWLKDPLDEKGKPVVDTENPDPAHRTDPILGMTNGTGFRFDGKKRWKDGRIYDPESGDTYKARMSLSSDTLKLRGYIGVPALGRTETFTRCAAIPE